MARKENTAPVEEKKTRTVLTAQQRIEKAKAELAALEAKEKDKAKTKLAAAEETVSKIEAKLAELNTKLESAKSDVAQLKVLAGDQPAEESQPVEG